MPDKNRNDSSYAQRTIRKVYVAGSGAELERAAEVMRLLRLAGIEVVSTWVENIRKVGASNPEHLRAQHRGWADAQVAEVEACDLFLMLSPHGVSHGAFWELGYADCLDKVIVVSGATATRSVFTARATCIDSDVDAIAVVARIVNNGWFGNGLAPIVAVSASTAQSNTDAVS
jgi:nucleoside 2-deoxyribosyltransferase